MSIAVSVLVKPSRFLLFLVGSMGFLIACSAVAIGFGIVGNLSHACRILVAALCISAAFLGFFQTFATRKTFRIDISGVGQIRLGEYNELAAPPAETVGLNADKGGEVVRLMADSTIWPNFMLLRLQAKKPSNDHIADTAGLHDRGQFSVVSGCMPLDSRAQYSR